MHELLAHLRAVRPHVQRLYDVSAWVLAFFVMATLQRVVGYSAGAFILPSLLLGLACGVGFLLLAAPFRLHEGRSPVGSFADAVLTSGMGCVVGAAAVLYTLVTQQVRVSVGVTGAMCAVVLMLGGRALHRVARDWALAQTGAPRVERQPVVVLGAGNGASQLVSLMTRDAASVWLPVALLDDDPYKRHRRLNGVPVVGPTSELEKVAERYGARTVILAIPTASAEVVRRFNARAQRASLDLKVLPSVNELSNPHHVQIADVRDIEVSDFLGRQPVETDVAEIAGYLTGRTVLVTGAGGSIGSELCRQIAQFKPAELIMLDRDESALHAVQLSIEGHALLDSDDLVLGDIRDERFVHDLFERRRPEVVFHAAALKHLPLLESAPGEAIKTNVWGTQTVLNAAVAAGVEHFVNVSTDKAADPTSVLGYSKRIAEGLTSAASRDATGSFLSVRFGNVLGSRGSVLTTFTAQIARGGPVTVTDRRVTRYFMTIGEAVQLVIQAGAIGGSGDVLVLDMGEPVSIVSVARQLIDMAGKPVDVVYTGLRDGEKLHEQLFGAGELDERPHHPLISHVPVPPYAASNAARLTPYGPRQDILRLLVGSSDSMVRPTDDDALRSSRWRQSD